MTQLLERVVWAIFAGGHQDDSNVERVVCLVQTTLEELACQVGWPFMPPQEGGNKKKTNLKERYLRRAECLAGEGDAILVCNKLLPAMHFSFA